MAPIAKKVDNDYDALLKAGFAIPRAKGYLSSLSEEINPPKAGEGNADAGAIGAFDNDLFDKDYALWAHSYGFCAKKACVFHLSEDNIDDYMSDYDYERVWPLNSWQRIWINDKLTFKYMMSGTPLDKYLPEYYYYSTATDVLPLTDSGLKPGITGFLDTLRAVGEFACKPCNGSRTVGFAKLSYKDGSYHINNKPCSEDDIKKFVHDNPNFVFIEFLHPSAQMAKISPIINNLRLQVFNPTGVEPVIGASYFRIAMDVNGDDSKTNYVYPSKQDSGNYNIWFNWKTGEFGRGAILYANRVVDSPCSPDTGNLAEGVLEGWQEVVDLTLEMSSRLNPLEYMGYDVCITDKGPKVIEINSHSGARYLQYFQPFYKDEYMETYFKDKVAQIEALGPEEIARRNKVMR